MKTSIYFYFAVVFSVLLLINCTENEDRRTAEQIGTAVADKIIRESAFELKDVAQKPVQNIQVLDYFKEFGQAEKGTYYSISEILSVSDTTLSLGVSFSGDLEIYINNKPVYSGKNIKPAAFNEIAYSMFTFQDTVKVKINKGENSVIVKLEQGDQTPIIYLRELPDKVESELTAEFELNYLGYNKLKDQWLCIGPLSEDINVMKDLLSGRIIESYNSNSENYQWETLREEKLKELVIPESNSYKRESYLEWHYANGTVLFGLRALSDVLNSEKYSSFVKKAVEFTVENYDLFKNQYEKLHAFRGSNHRMFRKTMLDDTGAPSLPYLDYFIRSSDDKVEFIVNDMKDYVLNEQQRLPDKTFCRPEPFKMSVWTDDLFMSVPFLVRLAKLENKNSYYEESALQVINFHNYLFDENTGLYKHGWFQKDNSKSIAFWGRANGWIIWATSEALLHIPETNNNYNKILEIFRKHINGIIKYQSVEGMWHQVLNKPESFKETSCTAMFIIGILRGVENGWLPAVYKDNALLAWEELKSRIMDDGTVKDICRGTGIGFDLEFYFNRNRFDNDPRGLGAVLTAAAEVMKLDQ